MFYITTSNILLTLSLLPGNFINVSFLEPISRKSAHLLVVKADKHIREFIILLKKSVMYIAAVIKHHVEKYFKYPRPTTPCNGK